MRSSHQFHYQCISVCLLHSTQHNTISPTALHCTHTMPASHIYSRTLRRAQSHIRIHITCTTHVFCRILQHALQALHIRFTKHIHKAIALGSEARSLSHASLCTSTAAINSMNALIAFIDAFIQFTSSNIHRIMHCALLHPLCKHARTALLHYYCTPPRIYSFLAASTFG